MYEFITIGGGEFFVDVFNGLAMIIKSGDFMDVIKISTVIAFMISLLNAALMGSLYDSGKWFLTSVMITQTLLYPTTSIHITDKTNQNLVGAKVDNVPFVIAFTAATSSQIGYSLTKMFESVYSLPNDLQYSQNGMIFGVNLLNAMSQAKISNSNLAASIDSFSRECIFYDILLGIYSFDTLRNSSDIWSFVKSTQVENRFFTYRNRDNQVSYPSCKDGSSKLEADWQQEFNNVKSLGFYAKKPNLSKSVLSSSAPLASDYLMNVSRSANQILQQSMMINALSDATENMEAESQIQTYQNARAAAQAKSTYQTMGTQAGIWIPMLKIVIESVFYGCFPIIILLCFIPTLTGAVLRGYLTTFFWLASWGPIYAILHRISMGHAASYLAPDVAGTGVGITLGNQIALQQISTDIAAMSGYMSMFTPMLAYGLAKGGAQAMSSMTTSFMSGIQGAVSTASHEGTTGNLSFGNLGLNSRTVSEGITMQNDAGQIIHRHNDGSTSIDNSKVESRLGTEINSTERLANEQLSQSSKEQSLSESKSIQSQQSIAQGFERMINDHRSIESSKGFEENRNVEDRRSLEAINTATDEFAKEHNITRATASEALASVNGGLGNILKVSGQISTSANDQKLYNEAKKFSEAKSLNSHFSVLNSSMQSNRFNLTDSKGESINQDFHKGANLAKEASLHLENSKRYSQQAQYSKTNAIEVNRNLNQELWKSFVNQFGVNEASSLVNPNNHDKSRLNQEIGNFIQNKAHELNIHQDIRPNFQSDFYRNSRNFAEEYRPSKQMQNEQNFSFSESSIKMDNSHLQQSTVSKFNQNQEMINESFVRMDLSPKEVVKGEQEKGVINSVGENLIQNTKESLSDIGKAGGEFWDRGGDIMSRFRESEARIKAKPPKNM